MNEETKHAPGPWRVSWAAPERPGYFLLHDYPENASVALRSIDASLLARAREIPFLETQRDALLEAARAIVEDLENAGEILLTDEARIQVLRDAIAQGEERG